MTPEQIDAMPAGKELDALIEELIYQAIPLTDDEAQLLRVAWWTTSPGYVGFTRLFKVPMKDLNPETGAMYRLGWVQNFSTDRQGAEGLVHRMRQDGWLFSLYEVPGSGVATLRIAAFEKLPHSNMRGCQGKAEGNTDALAISRAALKAKLMAGEALNRRGEM